LTVDGATTFPRLVFLVGSMREDPMQKVLKRMQSLVFAFGFTAVIANAQAPSTAQTSSAEDCTELPAVAAKLERADKILHDWPNLARYGEANTKIATPAKSEQRVVFMGDSITDMWVSPEFGGFFPGKAYIDRGISGQTTPQMLIRFRPDVIALQPKVVVILAGTNDLAGNTGPMTLGQIEDNLASMTELARAHGIRTVLSSVLPVSNYGHDRQGNALDMRINRPPEKILELNAWIKKFAAQYGYVYLDYFSAMVDPQGLLQKDLSEDGLHPNAKGYAVMGPLAEQAIRAALKKKR
jgi:lysophospholipase L1-like esterase